MKSDEILFDMFMRAARSSNVTAVAIHGGSFMQRVQSTILPSQQKSADQRIKYICFLSV